MSSEYIRELLKQKGLKITPQRVAIYEAVLKLRNHPTAEKITEHIKKSIPIFLSERCIKYWIRW